MSVSSLRGGQEQLPALAITPSTINEAAIADGITVQIPVYPGMAEGDAIYLDIGISLIRLLVLASAQVGSPVSCPLSSDQARDLFKSNGSAELAYDVTSASGKPYSSTPSALITVTVDLSPPGDVDPPPPEDDVLAAPVVREAQGGTLDLVNVPDRGVTVEIPAYKSMQVGDEIGLVWQGKTESGADAPYTPKSHAVTGSEVGQSIVLPFVPRSVVAELSGGSVSVSYQLTPFSRASVLSAALMLHVVDAGYAAQSLPPPAVDGAVDGVLDPLDWPNGATVRIEPYPGKAAHDRVTLHWDGPDSVHSFSDYVMVSTTAVDETISFTVPAEYVGGNQGNSHAVIGPEAGKQLAIPLPYDALAVYGGSSVTVAYHVQRWSTQEILQSAPLSLVVEAAQPQDPPDEHLYPPDGSLFIAGQRSSCSGYRDDFDTARTETLTGYFVSYGPPFKLLPTVLTWRYEGDEQGTTAAYFADMDATRTLIVTASEDPSFRRELMPTRIATCNAYTAVVLDNGDCMMWAPQSETISVVSTVRALVCTSESLAVVREDGVVVVNGRSADFVPLPSLRVATLGAQAHAYVAVQRDGSAFTWGEITPPLPPQTPQGIVRIAATHYAAAVMNAAGVLISWGDPSYGGQIPAAQQGMAFSAVIPGSKSFAGLQPSGAVVTWGAISSQVSEVVAVAATFGGFLALTSNGTVVPLGDVTGPLPWEDVVSLAATSNCFAALRADGTVAFANPEIVVDNVPRLENVISLVAGYETIAALQAGGTVVLLESNGDELSMLDCGEQVRNVIALRALFDTFYAQTSDGEILVFGPPGRAACPPSVALARMQRKFSFYK